MIKYKMFVYMPIFLKDDFAVDVVENFHPTARHCEAWKQAQQQNAGTLLRIIVNDTMVKGF